jgi:RsiW-degrading membrane proteinase PrsW (M82 family)
MTSGDGAGLAMTDVQGLRAIPWSAVAAWLVYVVVALVCLGSLLADLHQANIGPRAFAYGIIFALAPAPLLLAVFYFLDRLRPEPTTLLLVALIWGACIATFVALKLNGWLADILDPGDGTAVRNAVFIAPWIEEAAKGAVIFVIVWWKRDRLMSSVGGAVYAGIIGVGFAFTENIVYYSQVFQQALHASRDRSLALDAVQQLFWWRGVAAPFVHPMFTIMTGIGIGFAVRQRNTGVRVLAPFAGFLAAVLLHMSYNTLASYSSQRGLTASYIGLLLPMVVATAAAILLIRRHERRVIAARLGDYAVLGRLDEETVDTIATRSGRRHALATAKPFGDEARRQTKTVLRDGLDLGALRDRIVRGVAGDEELQRESWLLNKLNTAGLGSPPPVAMSVSQASSPTADTRPVLPPT